MIVSIPNMIASIAIIVTESGRRLNDSLSVLCQVLVFIHRYNLVWLINFVIRLRLRQHCLIVLGLDPR
jgi:hypothetical protein